MPDGFLREETAHTQSDLTNAVDSVEFQNLGAELKRLVPSLVLMGLVFSRSSGLVPNARSGDLREADKRHCNPHVLPFNHLSFERFDGYWVNCSAYGFLASEEGSSTCLKKLSSKRFTKRWMCCGLQRYRSRCKVFVACSMKGRGKFALAVPKRNFS